MAPKSKPKAMLSSKGVKRKHGFSFGKTYFLEIQWVRVGRKKRSKIDVKNATETERLGNLILIDFDRFGSHLGLPKRSQDAQKSMLKCHQNLISFLKPLGKPFFRPKSRQDAPAPQIAAEDGVGPGLLEEDLGGGKPDVQALRTFESRTGPKKICGSSISHALPRWAADSRRLRLGTAAPVD